jgi:hypothetical protein
MSDSKTLWNAQATANASTYKSPVAVPEARATTYQFTASGGSVAGTLSLEINTLPDEDYRRAVEAQAGATWTAKEAANTTGWVAQDLRSGGQNPHVTTATHVVSAAGSLVLYYPPGAYRQRFSFAATATGAISAYRRHIRAV